MNIKNLSLILLFIVVCFTCVCEARPRRRNRGRAGRNPKKSGEDPTIKFRQSVEKYKKLREEKRKRSLLEKRDSYFDNNNDNEISRVNALLLLGKHDKQGRKLYEIENNNLIQNEYVIDTVQEVDNNLLNNNFPQFNTKFQNKQVKYSGSQSTRSSNMRYRIDPNLHLPPKLPNNYKMRTVVKTLKKTISTNIQTQPATATKRIYGTNRVSGSYRYSGSNNYSSSRSNNYSSSNRYPESNISVSQNISVESSQNIRVESPQGVKVESKVSKFTTTRKFTTTIKRYTTTTRKITTTVKSTTTASASTSTNTNNNNIKVYQPKPGTKFQWQLSGCNKADTSVNADVFDFDLFETPVSKIKELQNKGKKVICYFSGGTIESWRDDAEEFLNKGVVLEEMEDWEDENWVNIRSSKLKPLIQNRLDLAVEKGCDGVEIDNVDGYTFQENDFTYNEQLSFNKWLASEAHKRNLSIGLKNDMGQIKDLLPHYDWALNEECYEYGECELYKPFINANKAVFGVSYLKNTQKIFDL